MFEQQQCLLLKHFLTLDIKSTYSSRSSNFQRDSSMRCIYLGWLPSSGDNAATQLYLSDFCKEELLFPVS